MGDKNYAEFQAKLLAGPPRYDPVEEHMRYVQRLAGWWLALNVAVAGLVLWVWDPTAASAAIVVILATGLGVRLARPGARRAAGPPTSLHA